MTETITYKLTGEKSKFKLLKQIMKEFGIKSTRTTNKLASNSSDLTKSEKKEIARSIQKAKNGKTYSFKSSIEMQNHFNNL